MLSSQGTVHVVLVAHGFYSKHNRGGLPLRIRCSKLEDRDICFNQPFAAVHGRT
jgi:hypothetical protein